MPRAHRGDAPAQLRRAMALGATLALLAGCAQTARAPATSMVGKVDTTARPGGYYKIGDPYQINGVWYYPAENYTYIDTGIASYYGGELRGIDFNGRLTANGEIYDMNALTAAHQTLPMPSLVRVTNLDNGRQMVLRVNDRGPFVRGRIIDVSRRSAQLLGFEQIGTAKVRVEILPDESRSIKLAMLGTPPQLEQPVLVAAAPREGVTSDALAPPPGARRSDVAVAMVPPPPPSLVAPASQQPIILTPPPRSPSSRADVYALPPAPASRPGPQMLPASPPSPPSLAMASGLPAPPLLRPPVLREVAALPVEQQVRLTPVVRQTQIQTSSIYISAGAYTNYDQATRLSSRLSRFGRTRVDTVRFGAQQLFRVRIGPIASVPEADQVYDQVTAVVPDARITVD